jgi:hypothetical protein
VILTENKIFSLKIHCRGWAAKLLNHARIIESLLYFYCRMLNRLDVVVTRSMLWVYSVECDVLTILFNPENGGILFLRIVGKWLIPSCISLFSRMWRTYQRLAHVPHEPQSMRASLTCSAVPNDLTPRSDEQLVAFDHSISRSRSSLAQLDVGGLTPRTPVVVGV